MGIDVIGQDQKQQDKMVEKRISTSKIDIYSEQMIFVEPMFIISPTLYRNMTLKLSLSSLIDKQKNMCRQAICLLNRTNNKELFLQYIFSLLTNKKLNLFSASMIFMKI